MLDLDALAAANAARRALQAAATPGPWRLLHTGGAAGNIESITATYPDGEFAGESVFVADCRDVDDAGDGEVVDWATAEFIAAARGDEAAAVIDALIAEVRALRADSTRLRHAADWAGPATERAYSVDPAGIEAVWPLLEPPRG